MKVISDPSIGRRRNYRDCIQDCGPICLPCQSSEGPKDKARPYRYEAWSSPEVPEIILKSIFPPPPSAFSSSFLFSSSSKSGRSCELRRSAMVCHAGIQDANRHQRPPPDSADVATGKAGLLRMTGPSGPNRKRFSVSPFQRMQAPSHSETSTCPFLLRGYKHRLHDSMRPGLHASL